MNSVFNTTSPDWTIALWFRESSPGQAYSGLFDIRTANQGWQTYHGAYTPITDVTTCAASGAGCGSFVNPVFGDWHSLIYRYDGTAYTIGAGAGGRLEVFVDGILALTLNSGNNPAVLLGQEVTAFAVGRFLSDSSPFSSSFDIDDIHVYNRVFTAQEQCTLIIGGAMGSAGNCKLP
jgi:hypothetical protein